MSRSSVPLLVTWISVDITALIRVFIFYILILILAFLHFCIHLLIWRLIWLGLLLSGPRVGLTCGNRLFLQLPIQTDIKVWLSCHFLYRYTSTVPFCLQIKTLNKEGVELKEDWCFDLISATSVSVDCLPWQVSSSPGDALLAHRSNCYHNDGFSSAPSSLWMPRAPNKQSEHGGVCGSCPSITSRVYHNHINPMWWSTLKADYAHTRARRQEQDPLKSYYMSDYALNIRDYPWDFMEGAGDKSSQSHTQTHTARAQQRQGECFDLNIRLRWSDDQQTVSGLFLRAAPPVSWALIEHSHVNEDACSFVCSKIHLMWWILVYSGTFALRKASTGDRQQMRLWVWQQVRRCHVLMCNKLC